jgi:hypothetical protein
MVSDYDKEMLSEKKINYFRIINQQFVPFIPMIDCYFFGPMPNTSVYAPLIGISYLQLNIRRINLLITRGVCPTECRGL